MLQPGLGCCRFETWAGSKTTRDDCDTGWITEAELLNQKKIPMNLPNKMCTIYWNPGRLQVKTTRGPRNRRHQGNSVRGTTIIISDVSTSPTPDDHSGGTNVSTVIIQRKWIKDLVVQWERAVGSILSLLTPGRGGFFLRSHRIKSWHTSCINPSILCLSGTWWAATFEPYRPPCSS